MNTEAEGIFRELHRHPDGKFGFAIYRCAYGDDAAWERFMQRMTAHVHAGLDTDPSGGKIKDHFTWDIFDNKEKFDGATKQQVREQHKQWSDSVGGIPVWPRYANVIFADQEVIDSVLGGDEPGSKKSQDILNPRAFVKVLDDQFEEEPEQLSIEDESDDELREKLNSGDEGKPAIEGCKRMDVGWVKVAANSLVPIAYRYLMMNGWHLAYVRPPAIFSG